MRSGSAPSVLPVIVGVIVVLALGGLGAYMALRSNPSAEAGAAGLDPAKLPGDSAVGKPQVKTASGLIYFDLKEGELSTPSGPTATVQVDYTGWLMNGSKFDSSADHGGPSNFSLGSVIRGWTEGVSTMKVGGKRKLIVPPELGYGSRGSPPTIPPNATLVFDIELLGAS